jgi:hypothetical protein
MLEGIEAELDARIKESKMFKGGASQKIAQLDLEYTAAKELLEHLAEERADVRREYLQKKTARFVNKFQDTDDDIGRDDDMDVTIEILQAEIDAVTGELEYIKTVLGDDAGTEDVDEEEEEEEEEAKEPPNESS